VGWNGLWEGLVDGFWMGRGQVGEFWMGRGRVGGYGWEEDWLGGYGWEEDGSGVGLGYGDGRRWYRVIKSI